MADERIEVEIAFTGTEAAATGTNRVAQSVDALAQQQTAAAASAIAFGQKLAAAAGAVQGLASALGVEGRAAGLLGSITQTSTSLAQLGASFGPHGALVGGIIGAAVPAFAAIQTAMRETAERNDEWRERLEEIVGAQEEAERAIRDSTDAIDEQADAVINASARMRDFVRSLSREGLAGQAFDTSARITALTDELADVNDQIGNLGSTTGADGAMRLLDLRERAAALTGEIGQLSDAFATVQSQVQESTAPRRGRTDDTDYGAESEERVRAATARFEEQIEAEKALGDDMRQRSFENHQEEMAQYDEKILAIAEQIELEERAALDRMTQAQENDDLLEQLNRDAAERGRARVEEDQAVTGVIVGGLTEALVAIVSGQKSAEEAFKGLLASFLTFISEQSALKAASEFAFAIADFASQNYSGGVQHLAAGVAFTAVAVAAGAGGAALSAPSAAAAGPQEGASSKDRDSGDSGGGNITVNYNAPVIGQAQEAESGRMIRGLIRAADDRFGA